MNNLTACLKILARWVSVLFINAEQEGFACFHRTVALNIFQQQQHILNWNLKLWTAHVWNSELVLMESGKQGKNDMVS